MYRNSFIYKALINKWLTSNHYFKIMVLLLIVLIVNSMQIGFAQTTTYILIRHAEKCILKDTLNMYGSDVPLSDAGKQRAQNLINALIDYRPDSIYSTNFIRTKSTVQPLAQKWNIGIQIYDAKKLNDFATQLKTITNKTIVIAGHSNTTAALVNLLLGENKYAELNEQEYNKIFIVIKKHYTIKSSVVEY